MQFVLLSWLSSLLEIIPTVQVNPNMISKLENVGLSFVGRDETGQRMEVSIW